jgi:hypothetical protein
LQSLEEEADGTDELKKKKNEKTKRKELASKKQRRTNKGKTSQQLFGSCYVTISAIDIAASAISLDRYSQPDFPAYPSLLFQPTPTCPDSTPLSQPIIIINQID